MSLARLETVIQEIVDSIRIEWTDPRAAEIEPIAFADRSTE